MPCHPTTIIDSHVHLWPESAANEASHAWMSGEQSRWTPQLIEDYMRGTDQDTSVAGIVYVETDRRYTAPSTSSEAEDVETWAAGPLAEITFLRETVEKGKGVGPALMALIPWAPLDQPTAVLTRYLAVAEKYAGTQTWRRVKGFRFLLQAIHEQTRFEDLVHSDHFLANLRLLGERGFVFEIGVDQRSGGSWQLEAIAHAMKTAQASTAVESKRARFVVNHLCKPDFSNSSGQVFASWQAATSQMAMCSGTYIKLSGTFSELPPSHMRTPAQIANHIMPWIRHVFEKFGPSRVMFGSDWPVCTFQGPGEEKSWVSWKSVVELVLQDPLLGLDDAARSQVWSGTAIKAYRLDS